MVDITGQNLLNLLLNGLLIGVIYALMALGLTLIFSVLGIVSFAHGEFYMIGGYVVYFVLQKFTNLNPYFAVIVAGLVTFIIGFIAERLLLQPLAKGEIERPAEYAILITFGLAFFLQFLMIAIVGPFPKKVPRFFDLPEINLEYLITTASTMKIWGVPLSGNRLIAGLTAVFLIGGTIIFMARTWIGRGLQAVSQDRQAAAVVGINPLKMNTLAFALGTLLAGLSGAVLVAVFSWVPWVGAPASSKAFVVIVLGGHGIHAWCCPGRSHHWCRRILRRGINSRPRQSVSI